MGLGKVGQVDLAGDGDLHRIGQPGQVFDRAGRGEQIIAGKLPVFGVQQPVQADADLIRDVPHIFEVGHRRGHDSGWHKCTKIVT